MRTRLPLVVILFHSLSKPMVRADCYTRNKELARDSLRYEEGGPELVSCGKGTNNCCLEGQRCGANLLCYRGDQVSREYCFDRDWKNCSTAAPDYPDAGIFLSDCGDNIFTFGEGVDCKTGVLHYIDPDTGVLYDTAVSPNKKPPAKWGVASSLILAAASASLSIAGTPATSTPITTYHTHETNSPGLSTGACIGIAVGVAVAITSVGILAWLFLRERRKRMMLQKKEDPPICSTPKMIHARGLPLQELENGFRNEAP